MKLFLWLAILLPLSNAFSTLRTIPFRFPAALLANSCETSCQPNECTSNNNTFILKIDQPLSDDELSNQNLIKIVNLETTDQQCNYLAWKCLGYQYNNDTKHFEMSPKVFPKFAANYPTPPDLIGVTRNYADPAVDKPVRDASMNLMRSVPKDFKGGVRNLESEGFRGYKLNELTPNKTRRAQLVNWLLFYRERLYGKTIEQLQAEAAERKKRAEIEAQAAVVDNSPSEMMYQRTRLDTVE